MARPQSRLTVALAALLAVVAAMPALADPPDLVGRLSGTAGVVSFRGAGEDQWSPAAVNDPVSSGAALWTEPQARADIEIGPSALHMDGATELDIDTLDDRQLQARLPQGTLNLHVAPPEGDSLSIATPRGTVVVSARGTYHIDAGTDSAPTRVAVLAGTAQLTGEGARLTLQAGQAAVVSGTAQLSYSLVPAQPTPFDTASLERDRRLAEPRPAARYISPEMTGWDDLDDYGSWRQDPQYGAVWFPQQVPTGWEPYRFGRWRWVAPWGWTWVDDQPWGFAPFHYGRWAIVDGRWGWVPGRLVARPVYAPALVAFVGGAGWHVALSAGAGPAIGWFPLAPREIYRPSYPASVAYIRNVNVTNVTNVTNIRVTNVDVTKVIYRNRQYATIVPQRDFAASHPVARVALHMSGAAVAAAPVARAAPLDRDFEAPAARGRERGKAPHAPSSLAAAHLSRPMPQGARGAGHAAGHPAVHQDRKEPAQAVSRTAAPRSPRVETPHAPQPPRVTPAHAEAPEKPAATASAPHPPHRSSRPATSHAAPPAAAAHAQPARAQPAREEGAHGAAKREAQPARHAPPEKPEAHHGSEPHRDTKGNPQEQPDRKQ
jgi:hypothetical protein